MTLRRTVSGHVAELEYVDSLVWDVVSLLREEAILDNTLVVVTSDHGENLGEHEMVDHVFNLYETTVRVPLLIRYPELFAAGARDDRMVQLLDLFPSVTRTSSS